MELAFTSEQGDEDKQGNVHTGLEGTTKTLVTYGVGGLEMICQWITWAVCRGLWILYQQTRWDSKLMKNVFTLTREFSFFDIKVVARAGKVTLLHLGRSLDALLTVTHATSNQKNSLFSGERCYQPPELTVDDKNVHNCLWLLHHSQTDHHYPTSFLPS